MTEDPYKSDGTPSLASEPPAQSGYSLLFLVGAVVAALVMISLMLPFRRDARGASLRTQCRNHLKQIGLALHNYHDEHGSFPPAHTVDAEGNPLHSWRTLILPFIGQQELYDAIDLSKPWNDPANQFLLDQAPHAYQCPAADLPSGYTIYLGSAAYGACFEPGRTTSISEITDGTSNTLMAVEVPIDRAVPWMAPYDDDGRFLLTLDQQSQTGEPKAETLKLSHSESVMVLLADGSVRTLATDLSPDLLRSLTEIADGQQIAEF